MNLISKEIRRAEHEYKYTPPPINALVTPLDVAQNIHHVGCLANPEETIY